MSAKIEPEYTGGRTEEEVDALVDEVMRARWKIKPALSADEWESRRSTIYNQRTAAEAARGAIAVGDWPGALAMCNAALPDGDPRKITRAMVDAIRGAASEYETSSRSNTMYIALRRYADALESFLPPADAGPTAATPHEV